MALTSARTSIRTGLVAALDAKLIDELLDAYEEAKSNFYLGGLRLSEVEGGRFCEAAYRLLQQQAFGKFDRLGKMLDTEGIAKSLANLKQGSQPDSIRLHIPRALRVVYDVRNNRDAAHLADGIDPNTQDGTLVVGVLDWVLAEFIRIHHDVSPAEAQQLVEDLVTRKVPVVQDFDGFPKVLHPSLGVSAYCLVLLYYVGAKGATYDEMTNWVRPPMRANLRRTLRRLADDDDHAHFDGQRYFITQRGQREAEAKGWLRPT